MKFNRKKGFTIIELVIVIAVIGILAAVLVPTFTRLIRKSRISSDTQLIRNLNTALEADKVETEHKTMSSALDAAKASGYDIAKINASATNNEILWDAQNDVFCYQNDGTIEYLPDSVEDAKKLKATDYRLWKIYTAAPKDGENFSIYVAGQGAADYVNNSDVNVGVDCGDYTIQNVSYKNTGDARDVVIRTNSASTTLKIDDASTGTIYHYGSAGALNIIQCHTASYRENGDIAFAEIAKGRIVLESGSEIKHIHVDKKTNSSFDTVIIADNGAKELPERITRDAVEVVSQTLVVKVESNGSSENVYVYADGETGTKGSTQKITEGENKQNENVNSALGQLVLDNGATADKAQTAEEKAEAKDVIASEAVSAEFEKQEGNGDYVARILQTGYMSLQAAVEAAVDGNTIHLLKDVSFTSADYLLINKDITLNLSDKSITGAHDPMIVIGASVGSLAPNSSQLTHTGHLTIKGEGSITSSNWDMICIFPDAVLDVYGGNYTGFKVAFYIYGGTLNTYGGNFTATSPSNTYIVQVKGAGTANIYAGNFTTPAKGGYGVYLDNASVSTFGSETGEGPIFNTWRPCISSNGSESHAVLANIYSGTYRSTRTDSTPDDQSVIQLANNTSETQTLNVYGGYFEQTSAPHGSVFHVRYGGQINISISGGTFKCIDSSRYFSGYSSSLATMPSNSSVHVTIENNAISTTQVVETYKKDGGIVRSPETDFTVVE